jgi:hypothetical protein
MSSRHGVLRNKNLQGDQEPSQEMAMFSSRRLSCVPRLTPLSACLGAALTLAAPATCATTYTVGNCNNSGSGSLRDLVSGAASGDTVDLSGLTTSDVGCDASTITLTTGAILINVDDLYLKGPGATKLTITGNNAGGPEQDRIITHMAPDTSGVLEIYGVTISYGYRTGTKTANSGGCIYSNAEIVMSGVTVTKCVARASTATRIANGGAVFAQTLLMGASTVSLSEVQGPASGSAIVTGGGISADSVSMKYSTVSNNTASSHYGAGGGIYSGSSLYIKSSTVANNRAQVFGGVATNASSDASAYIIDSTISGNDAVDRGGGVYTRVPLFVSNSTIAFNTIQDSGTYAGGLAASSFEGDISVSLQSSIIANNTRGGLESDFSVTPGVTVSGKNNLIIASSGTTPSGTLNGCPLLGPLRDNGGPTFTHALMSGSPAIDKGNNARKLAFDQRHTGYPRVSGTTADIGAYEVQQDDVIFDSGFDGCP